ncbi:unnamed protein product [Adineta steineri]|uniref:Uncharacterized protein n=1 Tax=Adineta steineri TaxID=433720 RepID=A0A818P3D5_9BILA|nr:unnamed protein product [Adineta steineri]CAF3616799.1 unnamed protein product [Adineta steineri]
MVWICHECKKDQHKSCENEWQCDCDCNVNGAADITQKSLAIGGGVALAVGGIALTVATGGLAAIFIGGAMAGAGVSSTFNGAEKAIRRKRIDGKGYAADVAFGAVTGVATGGMGAAGEVVAANTVKQVAAQGVKAGAAKLAVRATTGVVTGVAAKAIDEVKQCSTTDKEWKDYGKSFDENGKQNGTATAWIASAAVGGLGGASTHISSNLTKSVASGVGKSVTRVAVSGTSAALSDAAIQGANIAVGNQEKYDFKRTVTSVTASTVMTAAQEGIKNTVYQANSGKDNMLRERSNKQTIGKSVPEKDRQAVVDAYENLKKIPQSTLNAESTKANAYTTLEQQKANHQATVQNYDSQIKAENNLKQAAIKVGNTAATQLHDNNARSLINQKNHVIKNFNQQPITIKKSDIHIMNKDNAHFLTTNNLQQVAVDVKSPGATSRGVTRAIFDHDTNNGGRPEFKVAGYTDKHDYAGLPRHGQSDYYKFHEKNTNNLNVANGEINNLACNKALESERKKKKKPN